MDVAEYRRHHIAALQVSSELRVLVAFPARQASLSALHSRQALGIRMIVIG